MKQLLIGLSLIAFSAVAGASTDTFTVVIKDHKFAPAEIKVPSGKKVKLIVDNQDDSSEEFESHSLNREKVIAGHSKGIIFVGPLDPGQYEFVGEFHEDTAKGLIIAE